MTKLAIKGKVWIYPGLGGWHFVYVGKEDSERLRFGLNSSSPISLSNSSQISSLTIYRKRARKEGGKDKKRVVRKGFIPVRATLGDTTWDTSLFPTKEGPYLMSIKASVRKAEGVSAGDTISISCTLR